MKKLIFTTVAFAVLSAAAAQYRLDPEHTNVQFYIDHFSTSTNHAGFYQLTGTLQFDRQQKTGHLKVSIPMTKLYSGSAVFDNHLKSPEIFDAAKYPEIQFESTAFAFDGERVTHIAGLLTLHGQTRPVTLTAEKFNCYNSPKLFTEVCGGDFTASIDRTQWGINYLIDYGFAREVKIRIQAEAGKIQTPETAGPAD